MSGDRFRVGIDKRGPKKKGGGTSGGCIPLCNSVFHRGGSEFCNSNIFSSPDEFYEGVVRRRWWRWWWREHILTDIKEGGAGVHIVTDIKVKGRSNLKG